MCDAARRQLFGVVAFDDDGSDDDNMDPETRKASAAVVAIPIDDPVAFMATLEPVVPPECDPTTLKKFADLAKLTDEQIGELWLKYDADSSGQLERAEAFKFIRDCLATTEGTEKPTDEVLERVLRRMDTDASGAVSWEEFYNFVASFQDVALLEGFADKCSKPGAALSTDDMYALWGKYDADSSGELEVDEVMKLLGELTGVDPAALERPTAKRNKLSSFLKKGQPVTWDVFYNSFVPVIQAALKHRK